ncbi:MAG: efflux RND transporter permease subunit [cyanobacterium endosymbiont of Rhopalodia yunnanensis]
MLVNTSIKNLVIIFLQAIILIILVILVFLQDYQTTAISGTAILVVLVGAMIVLNTFSYTLNQLSLFVCVLEKGLVMNDEILSVEAVPNKLS